jgi:LuxR family maltose regulon positive regulatory protein
MARSFVPYILGRAYSYKGDLDRADVYWDQQIRLARAMNSTWTLSAATHGKIWQCRLRGQLHEAVRLLDEFDAWPREASTAGPIAKLIAARADIERERGNLERAAQTVQEAVQAVTLWGQPYADVCFCLQTRLRIELSLGRTAAAADDMSRIDDLARTSEVLATVHPLYEAERVRIYLTRGMVSQAVAWLHSYSYPEGGSPITREAIQVARARAMLASGDHGDARKLLDRLATEAEAGGRGGRLLEILVLQTMAETGDISDEALRRAFELAAPQGYVRVFLDEGEPMVRRLRQAVDDPGDLPPHLVDYARYLSALVRP